MSLVWNDPYLAALGNYVNLNYNKMNAKQNILILVKTYPEISRKYVETVCTAGILAETKKMIRLYPVRYRYLEGEFQFKKYQWIRAEIAKAISDSRPESYNLVEGKHHDAKEDAMTCAKIFLMLREHEEKGTIQALGDESAEFKGMVMGILADDEVNYKEAYELLYWLEDHTEIAKRHQNIYLKTKEVLEDDHLDRFEAIEMKTLLYDVLKAL